MLWSNWFPQQFQLTQLYYLLVLSITSRFTIPFMNSDRNFISKRTWPAEDERGWAALLVLVKTQHICARRLYYLVARTCTKEIELGMRHKRVAEIGRQARRQRMGLRQTQLKKKMFEESRSRSHLHVTSRPGFFFLSICRNTNTCLGSWLAFDMNLI